MKLEIYGVTARTSQPMWRQLKEGYVEMAATEDLVPAHIAGKKGNALIFVRAKTPTGFLVKIGRRVWDGVHHLHVIPRYDGVYQYVGQEQLAQVSSGSFECWDDDLTYTPNHALMVDGRVGEDFNLLSDDDDY